MTEKVNTYHIPVLREACIGMNIHAEGTYVDVTFGGGGHFELLFENQHRFSRIRSGFWMQIKYFGVLLISNSFQSEFFIFNNQLRARKVEKGDGILADLEFHSINLMCLNVYFQFVDRLIST